MVTEREMGSSADAVCPSDRVAIGCTIRNSKVKSKSKSF